MGRTKQTARLSTTPILRRVADRDQHSTNQEVHTAIRLIQDQAFSQGRIVEPTLITVTGTSVLHRLGRVPRGWFPVSPQGVGFVYQTQPPDDTQLFLQANVAHTTSLFVF